jgi:hypothetical protein
MQTTQPNSNPGSGLLLLLLICAAVVDFDYWKKGGQRTPKQVVRAFQVFIAIFVVVIAIAYFVVNPGFAGTFAGLSTQVVFACWEYRRWRIRRQYPIVAKAPPPPRPEG